METDLRPVLRPLEMTPSGPDEPGTYVLRDPEGFGQMLALSGAAAAAALLMDGQRTLKEIRASLEEQTGIRAKASDLAGLVKQLDEAYLLAGPRFQRHRQRQLAAYLRNPDRPAFHAGGAYAEDADELRQELTGYFTDPEGPGLPELSAAPRRPLRGMVLPHIDPARGGRAFACGYRRLVEQCAADRFVIFGTAHLPLKQWFSISRKDFATPLGTVPTDRPFIDRLAAHLSQSVAGRQIELFADEEAHRVEHSIEFQAVFLQFLLGPRRAFAIVPILVGSFHEFIQEQSPPDAAPEIETFLAALHAAEAESPGRVCYLSAADLAHLGRRFGDRGRLSDLRLQQQSADDQKLLGHVCRGDAAGFFEHVAKQSDRNRICGLPPTYMLLRAIDRCRGEVLCYAQAVEPDHSGCVSFASVALR